MRILLIVIVSNDGVHCITVVHYKDKWLAVVSTVMNLRFTCVTRGEFLECLSS